MMLDENENQSETEITDNLDDFLDNVADENKSEAKISDNLPDFV